MRCKKGFLHGLAVQESNIPDSRIWGLFADARTSEDLRHADKIVESAIAGRINFDKEFNLYGYNIACDRTGKKRMNSKRAKESPIDFLNEQEEAESSSSFDGISIDVVSYQADALSDAKSEFEALFDDAELITAVKTIKDLNEDFIVDYSIDLIALLKKAVDNIPAAVLKLKEVCEDFEIVAEQVRIILSHQGAVQSCFED